MKLEYNSPLVLSNSWGKMELEGFGIGRDFVVHPNGGYEWDWRKTGMHHTPGVRTVDIEQLLEYDVTVIVVGQGYHGQLCVAQEVYDLLDRESIGVFVSTTDVAVDEYNKLVAEGKLIAGLFHSTC